MYMLTHSYKLYILTTGCFPNFVLFLETRKFEFLNFHALAIHLIKLFGLPNVRIVFVNANKL